MAPRHGLIAGVLSSTRATATAHCEQCSWRAQHTADNIVEVGDFLRRRLFEHVNEQHPVRPS